MARAAVIGAGLSGLTAARMLADAGVAVTVLEKSRGLGGRLATRRTRDGLDFDHGAPRAGPFHGGFGAFLEASAAAGHAVRLGADTPFDGAVGMPGMSGLVAGLAQDIDVRFGVQVEGVARDGGRWRVLGASDGDDFDAVIVTAPAAQTARLCAAVPTLVRAANRVRMVPCWTVMATFSSPAGTRRIQWPEGVLRETLSMGGRPGRASFPERWVGHATAEWSVANLESPATEVERPLLAALCAAIGADPETTVDRWVHRWRYARVKAPVGETHLAADGLFAAGDWLKGPDAADAWASGRAAGAAALARLG